MRIILREQEGSIWVAISNATHEQYKVQLEYGYLKFDGSEKCSDTVDVIIPPFFRGALFEYPSDGHDTKKGCYYAKLLGSDQKEDHMEISITTDRYAHAVHFYLGDHVRLSDSYFDMLPGEKEGLIYMGS